MALSLTSTAFENYESIPSTYTCDEDRLHSPALTISGVPEGTLSLALLMDDPDIPLTIKESRGIDVVDHWVLYNIPPETREIPEGGTVGMVGVNTRGEEGYTGPCPPPEYEPHEHRYFFKLYALSRVLHFDTPPTKKQVLEALEPHIIEHTELVGRYSRA